MVSMAPFGACEEGHKRQQYRLLLMLVARLGKALESKPTIPPKCTFDHRHSPHGSIVTHRPSQPHTQRKPSIPRCAPESKPSIPRCALKF